MSRINCHCWLKLVFSVGVCWYCVSVDVFCNSALSLFFEGTFIWIAFFKTNEYELEYVIEWRTFYKSIADIFKSDNTKHFSFIEKVWIFYISYNAITLVLAVDAGICNLKSLFKWKFWEQFEHNLGFMQTWRIRP